MAFRHTASNANPITG